jgi:hypothetical protein
MSGCFGRHIGYLSLKHGVDLINYTNGGGGCTFTNQTSFKKGHTSWLGKIIRKKQKND